MSIELSIVIPVFNSAEILPSLVKGTDMALRAHFSFEMILVNDGSRDNSWQQMVQLAGQYDFLTCVNLRKNSGQDNALMAGLRLARGSIIVIMDDDLQHDPADIPLLAAACMNGADVCFAKFEKLEQGFVKNTGSALNGKMAEAFSSKPDNLYLSPFKALKRDIADEIVKFHGPFPYIDGIILGITSNFAAVPVDHHPRIHGKGNYSLRRSASVFMKHFTGFSILPLRIATITGLAATLTGFMLAAKYLYDYFIRKDFIEGWTTVVILIIIFGGIILVTLGIVGEYIGRMYLAINNKPQYSISEIVKGKN